MPTIEIIPWGLHWEVLTTEGNTYYHAIFIGTNSKELAEEYAQFKRKQMTEQPFNADEITINN